MATRKVTITLPQHQLARVRALVEDGTASSVSAFVQRSVSTALDDLVAWEAVLGEGLSSTGGDLASEERAWADEVLGTRAAAGITR